MTQPIEYAMGGPDLVRAKCLRCGSSVTVMAANLWTCPACDMVGSQPDTIPAAP